MNWNHYVVSGYLITGDIFLCLDHKDAFIFGLGAFLVGHIFYIWGYWIVRKSKPMKLQIISAIPFLIWGSGVLHYLSFNADIDAMIVPVCIYTAFLMLIGWHSFLSATDRTYNPQLSKFHGFLQKFAPFLDPSFLLSQTLLLPLINSFLGSTHHLLPVCYIWSSIMLANGEFLTQLWKKSDKPPSYESRT